LSGAAAIRGRDIAMPASTISLPSFRLNTLMLPPDPLRTLRPHDGSVICHVPKYRHPRETYTRTPSAGNCGGSDFLQLDRLHARAGIEAPMEVLRTSRNSVGLAIRDVDVFRVRRDDNDALRRSVRRSFPSQGRHAAKQ
jgi:hypothetical protein